MSVFIYTPKQVLIIGLRLAKWDDERRRKASDETNLERFKDSFGVDPLVYAEIWKDLQTTKVKEARIDTSQRSCTLEVFLISIRFLKKYDTEKDRAGQSGFCEQFCRDWGWYFLKRVAALCAVKIVWPGDWTTTFIISIDGVQCHFHEHIHPTLSKDPDLFAHKFNGPGLGYELALDLFPPKLVWLRGPFKPGKYPDLKQYQKELKAKIPDGKLAVVDGGYNDKDDLKLSKSNPHNPRELRKFKARAKARQESFHSRVKHFESVRGEFVHGMNRHQICFKAACVICQYEMDLVSPGFDI